MTLSETLLNDPLSTESDTAPKLGVEPATLRKWRTRGRGPVYAKIGGKIRYKLSDVLAFIEASRVVPGEKKHNRRRRAAKN
jgi:predicted site-specific integrase-resolvase